MIINHVTGEAQTQHVEPYYKKELPLTRGLHGLYEASLRNNKQN